MSRPPKPKSRRRYGSLCFRRRKQYGHRVAFEVCFGPVPNGMDVCHSCDRPLCWNPFHVFAGTRSDNMKDAKEKGRHPHGRTHGSRTHPEKFLGNPNISIPHKRGERYAAVHTA